jgi:hypothetical protein
MLAVEVSNWLRPGAATSPERLFCHVYGRGKGQAQMIPGWPYPVIAALEPGRTSWTAVLDAVRLGPDDDEAEVIAAQVRDVIVRLVAAGHYYLAGAEGGEFFLLRGSYDNHMRRTGDGWRIERLVQHVSWLQGNENAVAEARDRVQQERSWAQS